MCDKRRGKIICLNLRYHGQARIYPGTSGKVIIPILITADTDTDIYVTDK